MLRSHLNHPHAAAIEHGYRSRRRLGVGDHGIDRAPAALFATTAFASAADVPAAAACTTIVLVQSAFADGSSRDKVIPLLHAKRYKVVAVQNALSSLADDVAATRRVVDAQTGKVALGGHSWGGTVITEAGTSDKIKALVQWRT